MIAVCKQCGIKLFEQGDLETTPHNFHYRKIFRSFATRKDDEGNPYYLCIDCHEGKNKQMFEERQNES